MMNELSDIYKTLRLSQYKRIFSQVKEKAGSLSATEAFTAEVAYLLGEPTVGEIADFLGISQPNASYKINSLASKGYLEKAAGENDKREMKLRVTEKFRDYYGEYLPDLELMLNDAIGDFSDEEKKVIARFLESFDREVKKL